MPNRRSRPGKTSRNHLARFNTTLDKFLSLPAHFEQKYTDVVTQIYPLKADVGQLQKFCDAYLNLSGNPLLRFEAAVPWVFMQVVDYGKIAATSKNVGWFSQHELAFGVPVQRYKKEKKKWLSAGWTLVFPFIFVDNPLSMSGGREVYGWTKAEIMVDAIPAIFEPANLRTMASISLLTPGNSYGDEFGKVEFLRILQQKPFMSFRSAVSDVLTTIPRVIASSINAASSFLAISSSFVTWSPGEIESLQEVLVRFYGPQLNMLATGFFDDTKGQAKAVADASSQVNIVTLKQFRDVGSLSAACFQGLVGSTMSIEKVVDGGYLFDPVTGDATGGILISLLDTELQPIVQTLGISTTGDSLLGGNAAANLRPLLPIWLKMDLRYGLADYQCWRTQTTEWTIGGTISHIPRRRVPYTTIGSGAGEEVGGKLHFPRITFAVLPFRANKNKLQRLIDKYLENDFFEFQLAGEIEDEFGVHSVVCLFGSNFEKMTAQSDPGTTFSDRELAFAVPVLWWEKRNPGKKHPAVVPLFTFAGTAWNVATSYEVYGQLAFRSDLNGQEGEWLSDPTRSRRTVLLRVKTELFPELAKTQEARQLPVVEVVSVSGEEGKGSVANYLSQLGLNHLWTANRFHSIDLKQVVDAEDPLYADYQALVALERKFQKRGSESGPIAPAAVKIFDYPTLPIVETLGLRWDQCDQSGAHPVYTFNPVDPFWISGAMSSEAGCEMCWRVGTRWRRNRSFVVR